MPTPIGHALAGVALALAARRRGESNHVDWPLMALLAALAAAPDLDLLSPYHRTATHSFVSVALVTILAAVVTGKVTALPGPAWRLAVLCGAAWASHMLLDWLGADSSTPQGIQALWPFSDQWFISGWDVFRRLERRGILVPATMLQNALAVAQELLLLVPVVWGATKVRSWK